MIVTCTSGLLLRWGLRPLSRLLLLIRGPWCLRVSGVLLLRRRVFPISPAGEIFGAVMGVSDRKHNEFLIISWKHRKTFSPRSCATPIYRGYYCPKGSANKAFARGLIPPCFSQLFKKFLNNSMHLTRFFRRQISAFILVHVNVRHVPQAVSDSLIKYRRKHENPGS